MSRAALAAWCLGWCLACSTPEAPSGPEVRANQFLTAAISGDARSMWDSLDADSQRRLAETAGAKLDDPEVASRVFLLAPRFRWLVSIEPVTSKDLALDGSKATATVKSLAGDTMTLDLVQENGAWKVHLPPLAAPTPAPAPANPAPASTSAPAPSSAPTSAPASAPVLLDKGATGSR